MAKKPQTPTTRQEPTTEQKAQMRASAVKMAQVGTIEWMDQLVRHHEQAAKSLRQYRERFVEACAGEAGSANPADVLSWTVNEVNNIQRNCRLDMAVTHATRLEAAKHIYRD